MTVEDAGKLLHQHYPPSHVSQRVSDYLDGRMLAPRGVGREDDVGVQYWAGPLLPAGHPRRDDQVRSLKKAFAPRNLILEGCDRLADAVIAEEPNWSIITEEPELQALAREAEAALIQWWDRRKVHTILQRFTPALIAHGRGVLRPVLSPRAFDADGRLRQDLTPTTAALNLHLLEQDVQFSAVVVDDLEEMGITLLDYFKDNRRAREAEITWVGDDGMTYLRMVSRDGDRIGAIPLLGRLMLLQAELPRGAVTDALVRQNDAANVAYTLLAKNSHFAGFIERFGIGIDPPDGGLQVGADTANFFQPSAMTETEVLPNGAQLVRERPISNPQYGKIDPADPAALVAAIEVFERNIFSTLRQGFVLNAAGSHVSGRAQEVATADYGVAARRLAAVIEALIRDILGLQLALMGVQLGQPDRYAALRVAATVRVTAFPASPDERAQNRADYEAGLLSLQTARYRAGVSDPDAEQAQQNIEQQVAAHQ